MKHSLALLSLCLLFSAPAYGSDINIYADKQVEVHQNEQKLIAIGNAVARKDDNTIHADELSAFYEKNKQGKTVFKTLHAKGNVKAVSPTTTAYGNTMDYDLNAEEIILIGTPAKIVSPKGETITAEERIIYYPDQQIAIATGNVVAKDAENTVYSDKMISYFKKNAAGDLEMDEVKIYDNVKIVTPEAIATSDRGTYYPNQGKVHLFDNVIINQDGNIITGDHAETDLNTGVSRMLSSSSGKRVSGVFKEKKDNNKNKDKNKVKNSAKAASPKPAASTPQTSTAAPQAAEPAPSVEPLVPLNTAQPLPSVTPTPVSNPALPSFGATAFQQENLTNAQ